jgi:hypothetical protein
VNAHYRAFHCVPIDFRTSCSIINRKRTVLVLDGVFAGLEEETPRFYPLRAPDDPNVAAVAETVSRRTQALWKRKGIGASDDGEAEDPLMRDMPWLAGLYAHGVRWRIATGPNTGNVSELGGSGAHANLSSPAH